ncbi:hypothetical protein SAMN05660649_05078 [Desulfotomaculum arcticum]|uniref:Apea-like HEPN domain-containing protein n=1 Tax=Desulfotruncus arcticus DSM 17038 TaxID=1121424 RepID=A0A1I2ZT66_9FIRM|nr:HEPN domain-containing protein [Desulfotruncus arcticus]SFH40261.1 hypothetical protein SAMN05660649_05078 [Desulfotomaculum arcticum] [Desulfotruncus arcticus DSM 17038]
MSKKLEYLLVKKKDDFCNTIEQFQNFLLTNKRLSIAEDILTIDNHQIKYNLIEQDIEKTKELSFHLSFESLSESEDKEIEALETADKFIRRIIDTYSNLFYINTIWDDVSTYYGIKAYPKINSIENKMRKIIYIFMIRNSGSKWVERNIPRDVKESIKKTQEKNNIHNMLEDCLYCADFIQLGYFFFEKYPINRDWRSLIMELKKAKQLDNDSIDKMIEKYVSTSNWERYFAGEIQVDELLDKWQILYEFRNKVAHNKKIQKKDFTDAIKILDELEGAFDKCLERINQIEVPENGQNAIEEIAEESIEKNLISSVGYATIGISPAYLENMNQLAKVAASIKQPYLNGVSPLAEAITRFTPAYNENINQLSKIAASIKQPYLNGVSPLAEAITRFTPAYNENINQLSKIAARIKQPYLNRISQLAEKKTRFTPVSDLIPDSIKKLTTDNINLDDNKKDTYK